MVPYKALLLKKYRCHSSAEVAAGARRAAYLYKYVFKGCKTVQVTAAGCCFRGVLGSVVQSCTFKGLVFRRSVSSVSAMRTVADFGDATR